VNALLYDPATEGVIDYVGGLRDLEQRLIRAVGDPDTRFGEDHLRVLRAIRLASELGFAIEAETEAAIRRHASGLKRVSAERIKEEFWRLIVSDFRGDGIRLAARTGVLEAILPEACLPEAILPEAFEHLERLARRVAAARRPTPTLAMALLLLDAGLEQAEAACGRLRCSGAENRIVRALVAAAATAATMPSMMSNAIRAMTVDAPPAELIELFRADAVAAGREPGVAREAAIAIAASGVGSAPTRLLSGDDLVALGYTPGPAFARILAAVEAARASREIAGVDEARAWVLARFPRGGPPGGPGAGPIEA
jgi:poly(A) polymerase